MVEKRNSLIQSRIEWVDYIKGICIVFVLLSHFTFIPRSYKDVFFPFLLIGFLFTSGYTHNIERDNLTNLKRRIRNLLIPFILLGFLTILATQILSFSEKKPLGGQIRNMFLQIRGQDDVIWFVAAMFLIDLVYHSIVHNISNKKLVFGIFLCWMIIEFIYFQLVRIPLPWHIQMIGTGCFWMYMGYCYKRYVEKKLDKVVNWISTLICWLVYLGVMCLINLLFGHQNINFFCFGSSFTLYLIESVMALVSVLFLCKSLRSAKLLAFFGRNTLVYFAFHGKVESILLTILDRLNLMTVILSNDWYIFAALMLLTFIEALVLIIPCLIINRYLPFLVGKSYSRKQAAGKYDQSKIA